MSISPQRGRDRRGNGERSEHALPSVLLKPGVTEERALTLVNRPGTGKAQDGRPMLDARRKSPMTPQRHDHKDRILTMSMPGLLFLGPRKDLIACNAEAIRILYYPDQPDKERPLSAIANKIPVDVLRPASHAGTRAEFRSGGRRYICSVHSLNAPGRNKATTAILLERAPSPEVTLHGICQKYNLTAREREAMSYLLRGQTSKEIAQEMSISPNTVKAFLHSAMSKMGVSTRAGLIGRIAGTTPADRHGYRDLEGVRGT